MLSPDQSTGKRPRVSDSSSGCSTSESPVFKHCTKKLKEMAEDQYTTLLEKLSTLQISMDTANASLSAMDKTLGENVVKTNMLEDKMSKLQLTCDVQAKKIEHLQERVEKTESRWLENNLMFCGFAERGKNETVRI
jgi:hypothetical protein